jgi:hypothetical protein
VAEEAVVVGEASDCNGKQIAGEVIVLVPVIDSDSKSRALATLPLAVAGDFSDKSVFEEAVRTDCSGTLIEEVAINRNVEAIDCDGQSIVSSKLVAVQKEVGDCSGKSTA